MRTLWVAVGLNLEDLRSNDKVTPSRAEVYNSAGREDSAWVAVDRQLNDGHFSLLEAYHLSEEQFFG